MSQDTAARPTQSSWQLRPQAPAIGTRVGWIDDIAEGGCKEFVFGTGLNAFRMFVVRRGAGCLAYLNLCPHYSLPLNVREDEFLSRDGTQIMCRRHLAVFRIEDGLCVDGACTGSSLEVVPISVDPSGMMVVG